MKFHRPTHPFRYDRDLKGRDRKYLNVFPSEKAVQREREKLREMTNRHKPIQVLIGDLNRHLKGWMNYFPSDTHPVPTVRSNAMFGTV